MGLRWAETTTGRPPSIATSCCPTSGESVTTVTPVMPRPGVIPDETTSNRRTTRADGASARVRSGVAPVASALELGQIRGGKASRADDARGRIAGDVQIRARADELAIAPHEGANGHLDRSEADRIVAGRRADGLSGWWRRRQCRPRLRALRARSFADGHALGLERDLAPRCAHRRDGRAMTEREQQERRSKRRHWSELLRLSASAQKLGPLAGLERASPTLDRRATRAHAVSPCARSCRA